MVAHAWSPNIREAEKRENLSLRQQARPCLKRKKEKKIVPLERWSADLVSCNERKKFGY